MIRGKEVTEEEMKKILNGEEILIKGLTSKGGASYDMYVKMSGFEEYEGKEYIQYETRFPER